MPGRTVTFNLPLHDIPEEGTPLVCDIGQDRQQLQPPAGGKAGCGGDGGPAAGSGQMGSTDSFGSAATAKQPPAAKEAGDCDLESSQPGGGSSWRPRLRWPVVPIYSDVGTGHWWEASLHYITMTAAPAAWLTGPFALSQLTWAAGVPLMALVLAIHAYSAMLLAELHTWNKIIRHTRYRDLGKSIWGLKGFHLVFCLQNYGAMLGCIPVVLSTAIVMKSLHAAVHPEGNIPIAWWLLLYGIIQLMLSQFPTTRHLRHLNAAAAVMTAAWTIMTVITVVQTGQADRRAGTVVSYGPPPGSLGTRVLGVFEAPSIWSFSIANVMLPEIQSVVKPPAVANGRKAFTAALVFIGTCYLSICIAGYWAFGNAVGPVFTLSIPVSSGWQAVTLQILLIVQICICLQLWARPTFEVMEYLLIDYFTTEKVDLMSPKNCVTRLGWTGVYVLSTTYLAGLLPAALGDWANLVGAICYIPLNLVLPMLMWNAVMKPPRWRRVGHIVLSCLCGVVSTAAITSAIFRLATVDKLEFWADVQV